MNEEIETNELDQIREALKTANGESAANRHKVKELEQQVQALSETAERVTAKYRQVQIDAQLERNGITNTKITKLLDLDQIELDDEGNVTGLDEQIETVKSEFPELFETKRSVPKVDAADKPAIKRQLTTAERLLGAN
ncbi:phage scaffolding protein [Rhodococcus sp. (in: high G+C Gram-positive bacteria)]|uniref:phage scaffolding protein n=1 Tax=Rhodococcus sp. TaxID=1831 RepID=UPI001A2494C9|nr:phage scaffolding protein [Rhodococcus sp. (in: high G+C Gram-positive bacteria)]MBJ7479706.1 phage scaffolding protein [Rhodococcus sp. (in: high G+C Gram-positive bacteria)]